MLLYEFITSYNTLNYELTKLPAPRWLDSSVGRALHQYHKGHGFKYHSGLNFFGGLRAGSHFDISDIKCE